MSAVKVRPLPNDFVKQLKKVDDLLAEAWHKGNSQHIDGRAMYVVCKAHMMLHRFVANSTLPLRNEEVDWKMLDNLATTVFQTILDAYDKQKQKKNKIGELK